MAILSELDVLNLGKKSIASSAVFTCDTASATANKTISLTAEEIVEGLTVRVKFTHTNTASSPTINNYGLYLYGTVRPGTSPETSWYDNEIVTITFTKLNNNWVAYINASKKQYTDKVNIGGTDYTQSGGKITLPYSEQQWEFTVDGEANPVTLTVLVKNPSNN